MLRAVTQGPEQEVVLEGDHRLVTPYEGLYARDHDNAFRLVAAGLNHMRVLFSASLANRFDGRLRVRRTVAEEHATKSHTATRRRTI